MGNAPAQPHGVPGHFSQHFHGHIIKASSPATTLTRLLTTDMSMGGSRRWLQPEHVGQDLARLPPGPARW